MSSRMTNHPSRDDLNLYGQGRLEGDRLQVIEEHIASCDSCCDLLRAIPDDTLLNRLRQTETEANDNPPTNQGRTPQGSDGLPVELQDHPRYRIIRRLGSGGMGVVYKAEHRIMERLVALKVMNQRLIRNQMALERFRMEVKAAARLSHPNIVTAHDADQAGELQVLVMEFVDGISVARQVEKAGPMPIRFACLFARQAALGLQHAHEKEMIHRDIKPQNLMLTRDVQVKILDFGLARCARGENPTDAIAIAGSNPRTDSRLTQDGTALGTPDYMAPEQIQSAATVDIRADIYSLGCTLYFMLTGHAPFPTGTVADKLVSHLEREPVDLSLVRPEVPAGLRDIVHRMMAKKPADRFVTPADVADALLPFTKSDVPLPAVADSLLSLDLEGLGDPRKLGETVAFRGSLLTSASQSSFPPILAKSLQNLKPYAVPLVLIVAVLLLVVTAWNTLGPALSVPSGLNQSTIAKQTPISKGAAPLSNPPSIVRGAARILVVVPHDDFWTPDVSNLRRAAKSFGAKLKIASSKRTPARPSPRSPSRETEEVDLLLSEAKASDYDAILFTGAYPSESLDHLRDKNFEQAVRNAIQQFVGQGKPIASICMGSRVLADLGFLQGRAAARCPHQPVDEDYSKKARWTGSAVQMDGPFVTGKDQNTAELVIQKILTQIR